MPRLDGPSQRKRKMNCMKKVSESLSSLSDQGSPAHRDILSSGTNRTMPVVLWWTNRHPTQGDNALSSPAEQGKKPTWHPGKGRVARNFRNISHSSIFTPSATENSFGVEVVAIQSEQVRRRKASRKRFFPDSARAILSREKRATLNSGSNEAQSAEDRPRIRVPSDHHTAHNGLQCESFHGYGPQFRSHFHAQTA